MKKSKKRPGTAQAGLQVPVPTLVVGAFDLVRDDLVSVFAKVMSTGSAVKVQTLRGLGNLPRDWTPTLEPGKESWFRPSSPPSIAAPFYLKCIAHVDPADVDQLSSWLGRAEWRGKDPADPDDWERMSIPVGASKYTPIDAWHEGVKRATGLTNDFLVSFEGLDAPEPYLHWYRRSSVTVSTPFCQVQNNAVTPFVPEPTDKVIFHAYSGTVTTDWHHRRTALVTAARSRRRRR